MLSSPFARPSFDPELEFRWLPDPGFLIEGFLIQCLRRSYFDSSSGICVCTGLLPLLLLTLPFFSDAYPPWRHCLWRALLARALFTRTTTMTWPRNSKMGSSMWTQTTASSNGNGLLEPSGNYVGFDIKQRRVIISPMANFIF